MEQIYVDKYGDEWIRENDNYVIRILDGTKGGWFKGEGLILKEEVIIEPQSKTNSNEV